jgi:hypothetical protein
MELIKIEQQVETIKRLYKAGNAFGPVNPNHPNQLSLKDLRSLEPDTELLFHKFYVHPTPFKLRTEKRQFIKLELTPKYSATTPYTWAIISRDVNGDINSHPLRAYCAVKCVRNRGWRQDAWIALNI